MRIVAVSMVKNESDIVESFVRHHADMLHAHYVLDNRSSDPTFTILQRLRAEFPSLIVMRDANGLYDQSRKMTELMRKAAVERDADFILPLDADEFILDRGALERQLAQIGDGIGMLRWFDYIAKPTDDTSEADALRRITHRIEPSPQRYKVCVPRTIALRPSVRLAWGQHDIEGETEPLEHVELEMPQLAHFPIRSGPQLVSKAVIGRLAIRASHDWKPQLGFHWDHIAETIEDPSSVSDEELFEATLILSDAAPGAAIVHCPLRAGYSSLKYPELISVDIFQRLLALTSDLLDDEMSLDPEYCQAADEDGDRRPTISMGRDWRHRWQESHAEAERLKQQLDALSTPWTHSMCAMKRTIRKILPDRLLRLWNAVRT